MRKTFLAVCLAVAWGPAAHGQLFSGPSAFTQLPTSQVGSVTNNLVLTDTATGFVVTGQVIINVAPGGPHSGILAAWMVERPLNPGFGSGTFTTTTILDGFSQPPLGAFNNTGGGVSSEFTSFGGSVSQLPISLVAGAATWNNLSNTSGAFSYTSGAGNVLRQYFFVDGVQLAGPGGNWVVDVPVTTIATELVPEPTSVVLAGLGLIGAIFRLRRG